MSEVNRRLEEIEQELLKQKKRTKRLLKMNKTFDKERDELFDQNNEIEKYQKLEVRKFDSIRKKEK